MGGVSLLDFARRCLGRYPFCYRGFIKRKPPVIDSILPRPLCLYFFSLKRIEIKLSIALCITPSGLFPPFSDTVYFLFTAVHFSLARRPVPPFQEISSPNKPLCATFHLKMFTIMPEWRDTYICIYGSIE